MAKNRHSTDCPSTTPFDREIKKRFFSTFSIPRLTNLRGIFTGNEEANTLFSKSIEDRVSLIVQDLTDEERQELKSTYGTEMEIASVMEHINKKLSSKKELTPFEDSFMEAYADAISDFLDDEQTKDIVNTEMRQAGFQDTAISKMHSIFKAKIPAIYRNEVRTQLCSLVMQVLDRAEDRPEYKHFTRKEIIDNFHLNSTNLRGFDCVMFQARRALEHTYKILKQRSETIGDNGRPLYEMPGEQEQLFQTLLNDDDAWSACIYETKSLFLDAEKIKIGNEVSYAEELEDDETENADPEAVVQTAEEGVSTLEHWQLKADTISSFNSMAREVRSLLFRLTTGEPGVLGFPSIVDTMLIHETLMEIRGENYCQDSSEFLEVLKNTNVHWAQELYKILINDPWKRTAVFNTYRKNHLNYVYHRKSFYKGMPTFFRNKSGRNARVLMGAYRAGITHIDPDNKSCLFTADGLFNIPVLATVKLMFQDGKTVNGVPFWNEAEGVYDMRVWGNDGTTVSFTDEQIKERQRDFVITVSDILNLHLSSSDIDTITSSSKQFKAFCESTHEVLNDITKLGGYNRTVNSLFESSRIKKHFQRLVRAAKHTITVQERKSPVEKAFRYNKSTYMAHTVPNSLGDNLERLGKYAAQGEKAFKQYLEETFLKCPVFATKTATGYNIHNYWLRLMYSATDTDLKNPASFVNRLINECTRGLGTDTADFASFTEKDNYIFTLNEYMQNSIDSDGKFGATPLFITGDSNSTRFLTTPILSSEEVLNEMINNVIQEIERMSMFDSMIEFFESSNLKVSEGHAGKTVAEWMREPEERRPSILRNRDKFTFFPFLNAYKEELLDLYHNPKTTNPSTGIEEDDPTRSQFRVKTRELLEAHLRSMYETFMDDLKDKDIVQEIGRNHDTLNPTTVAFVDSNGELLDTTGYDLLWKFYLNTKFNLIQEESFLTIDPGFYKNTEDFQKRFKENIAAGDLLDLEALDPSDPTGNTKIDDNNGKQKVRYIDEILTDLDASDEDGGSAEDREFMQALREAGFDESVVGNPSKGKKGKYNKNTLTDGQGYRSFSSYRKLMIMRGEPHWSKAHEEVYQIIKRNREAGRTRLSKKDLQRILDLGVVFQPLKPFYFGFEELVRDDGTKILIPVQHKYSEYPIIPELLPIKNSKDAETVNRLNALGQAMEEDGTDLVCCTTCVKVGGFGSTDVKHCKTKEDFKESFGKGRAHQLPLQGWRQQSNIPESVDHARARGTQFTKHGYGSISETSGNKHYSFVERTFSMGKIKLTKSKEIDVSDGLNAQNLIQLFGAIGSAPFIRSINKLSKQISSPREASKILSELRANDTRGAKDNIAAYTTDENGEILLSPAEGIMAFDNMASLLSKLRKGVIKQPIKGGSAVQVSAFGFDDVLKVHCKKTPNDKINIVYADCAMPFAFSYTYEDGTTIDLSKRYLDFVDHETGMLLDENGEPVEPAEPTGEPGKEFYGWNTKLGKQFPGILDLIAYRIPTEKDYSILNLKARRFWPITAGGTIMVPSQFTTIAGFDFDIDKLYFIRREYQYKRQPNIGNYDIWTDFYTETPIGRRIKPYLQRALDRALSNESEESLFLGKDLYNYWRPALNMMSAEGIDISDYPDTAEEAFVRFVSTNTHRYAKPTYEYDESKTVLENNPIAVNNLFFDYMQARLEDYDTFSERYIPGGFQMLKDAKPVMMAIRYGTPEELAELVTAANPEEALMKLAKKYKDFSPAYDPTELSTIAHYQTFNALYDNCISISAVQNINQRLTALTNSLELKQAVLFGSLLKASKDGTLSKAEKDKLGKDIRSRFVNGIDTELLTTNYLASAVDAVKEALLEFFGIDDKNLNIGCLLSKIGCSPVDIGLLLNQPVVIKAMEIMKEGRGYKSLSNSLDEAMQEIAGNSYRDLEQSFYYGSLSGEDNKGNRDAYVDTNSLIRYLGMNASPKVMNLDTFVKGQFAVVHLMKELQADAQELAEQVSVTQSTSIKSVKSTFGAIQAMLQKVMAFSMRFGGPESRFNVSLPSNLRYIIDPTIRVNKDNMEDVLGECLESPYCMEQIAFSAIVTYAEVLGDYFPYTSEGFLTLADGLAALTNRGYLSAELFDAHNKAAMLFLIERMTSMFNESNHASVVENGQITDTGIPNRIFYTKEFPEFFKSILEINDSAFKSKKTDVHYKDIPILGSISAEMEKYDKGVKERNIILKMEGIGGLNSTQKDNLIESWEAMFLSDDPVLRDLAKHLFLYSYYNKGFDFGPTTFMSLVPLLVKMQLEEGEYAEFFNRVFNLTSTPNGLLQELSGNVDEVVLKDYYKAFILNTKDNFYQFTKKIYAPKGIDEKSPYNIIHNNMEEDKSSFTVTIDDEEDAPLLNYIATPIKDVNSGDTIEYRFAPCIEIDGATYICDNDLTSKTNSQFNILDSGTMTFYRMDEPLGTDYSTPQLYGSRDRMLQDIGHGNLVSIIRSIIEGYRAQQETTTDTSNSEDSSDTGNVMGSGAQQVTSTISPLSLLINTIEGYVRNIKTELKPPTKWEDLSQAEKTLAISRGMDKQSWDSASQNKLLDRSKAMAALTILSNMIINLSAEGQQAVTVNTLRVLEDAYNMLTSPALASIILKKTYDRECLDKQVEAVKARINMQLSSNNGEGQNEDNSGGSAGTNTNTGGTNIGTQGGPAISVTNNYHPLSTMLLFVRREINLLSRLTPSAKNNVAIDLLKALYSELYNGTAAVSKDTAAIIENTRKIMTSPDVLEPLRSMHGDNINDRIDSILSSATTSLNIALAGNLESMSAEGQAQYQKANNGNPIC